jgi:hypothetical protein
MSGAEIARKLGRSQRTIGKVLNAAEYQHARDLARSALAQHAEDFAYDFLAASKVAALSGRHEAARDALMAIGAIEGPSRHERTEGIKIQIGVAIPGLGPSAQHTLTVPVAAPPAAIPDETPDSPLSHGRVTQ